VERVFRSVKGLQQVGLIAVPLAVMTVGTFLFLSPRSTSEDSTTVFLALILLALAAGFPFTWRVARGKRLGAVAIVLVYVGIGFVILLYLPLVINCGIRAICE
jgi:phosphatidylserine synthase